MLKYLFILLLAVLIVSCETVVELDVDNIEQKLSISGIFDANTDAPFEIEINQTRIISSNTDFAPVQDATVRLFNNGELLEEMLPAENKYSSTYTPEEGQQYSIEIEHPDYETIYASSYLPQSAELGSTTPKNPTGKPSAVRPNYMDFSFDLDVEVIDNPQEKNYYHLLFYYTIWEPSSTGLGLERRLYLPYFNRDRFNEPEAILSDTQFELYGAYLDDSQFKAANEVLTFSIEYAINPIVQQKDELIVELRTVSEEYYKFHTSAYRNSQIGSDPLNNTPAPIESNIENGLGLFGGYVSSFSSTKIPQ